MTAPTQATAREAVERQLQVAIDAGPNMEPWDLRLSAQHLGSAELVLPNGGWFMEIMDGTIKDDEQQAQFVRDAAFIATASPANISKLLALLAAKQEELDKMRADAERYEFLCTCTDEVTMDFLAECIGSRQALDELVDALRSEKVAALSPSQQGEPR